jgi:hypothetical protein
MTDVSGGGYSRATWTGLALLGAVVVVTLLLSWQIRPRDEQIADALEAAPLVAIADFPATGYARIEGRVRLFGRALTAPFSGRRCAYYEIDVEVEDAPAGGPGDQPADSGDNASRRASRRHDFELVDATAVAVIRLRNAMVAMDDAHCQRGILAHIPASRRAALSADEHLAHLDGIDPARVRFRECVLPADARVAVAGAARAGHTGHDGLVLGLGQGPIYVGLAPGGSD